MKLCCYFLPQKKNQRQNKNAPCKEIVYENKGSKHHGIVPVVDSAASAALVAHNPCLEGTEEEYANHIAYRVCKADKNKYSFVNNADIEQDADNGIEENPEEGREECGFPT